MTRPERPPCAKCGQVHARCVAHAKNATEKGPEGRPCGKRPIIGLEVCGSHGGSAAQARKAGARRAEEAAAVRAVVTLGLPVDVSPTEALLQEVQWTAGHVHWLRSKVQELDPEPTHTATTLDGKDAGYASPSGNSALVWGTTKVKAGSDDRGTSHESTQEAKPSIWYDLYVQERRHLVVVCAAALKAGVEERRVRLAESQGDLVATAIRHILDALELTSAQTARIPLIVPQQLRLIAGGQA